MPKKKGSHLTIGTSIPCARYRSKWAAAVRPWEEPRMLPYALSTRSISSWWEWTPSLV